jgi:hypothetical protein
MAPPFVNHSRHFASRKIDAALLKWVNIGPTLHVDTFPHHQTNVRPKRVNARWRTLSLCSIGRSRQCADDRECSHGDYSPHLHTTSLLHGVLLFQRIVRAAAKSRGHKLKKRITKAKQRRFNRSVRSQDLTVRSDKEPCGRGTLDRTTYMCSALDETLNSRHLIIVPNYSCIANAQHDDVEMREISFHD